MTPHTARHSYCSNWIHDRGHDKTAKTKLSHQVGASVARLRATYIHVEYGPENWAHLCTLGERNTASASQAISG